jgi:thioredoxin 1
MALIELNKDNLESTINDNDIVLIDFWADWCGPCKMFRPVFHKAAETHQDITFASCDTEAETEVAASFGIRSIPTLAIFREQILLFLEAGALPEPVLEELIGKVKELDMDEVRAKIAEEEAKHGRDHGHDHDHDHDHGPN